MNTTKFPKEKKFLIFKGLIPSCHSVDVEIKVAQKSSGLSDHRTLIPKVTLNLMQCQYSGAQGYSVCEFILAVTVSSPPCKSIRFSLKNTYQKLPSCMQLRFLFPCFNIQSQLYPVLCYTSICSMCCGYIHTLYIYILYSIKSKFEVLYE